MVVGIDDFFSTTCVFAEKTSIGTGKTMKKQYQKHSKDYKLVSKELPNGKIKQVAIYTGKYYICMLNETEFRKFKFYFLTLALCSSITVIGIGFLNNPGSRVAYVSLPYVSLFLPMVYGLLGAIKFAISGLRLDQTAYDKSKIRIHRSTIWQIALSGITILGDTLFILFNKNMDMLYKELIFTGCMIFIFISNILYFKLQMKVAYQVEDPE